MKRQWIRGLFGLACGLGAAVACAQGYPVKPISLVVPFPPGASADGIARIVGRELSDALGQPVVVENKPGAGGSLALVNVARAPADGYTIAMGATGAIAVSPHLPDAAPLDPQKDLAPIAKLADIPLVVVAGPKSGYASLQALLDKARGGTREISFGTPGQYTAQHLAGELLAAMSGVKMVAVPYRGSSLAVTDLMGGQVELAVVDLTSAYPHIQAGTLTALGVTSANRSQVAPEVPTIAEAGVPGYGAPAWMGLFAPAGTPPEITARLAQAMQAALARPDVRAQVVALAADPSYLGPQAFADFIRTQSGQWADIIKSIPAQPR